MKRFITALFVLLLPVLLTAETGYDLWLRYRLIDDPARLQAYRHQLQKLHVAGSSPTAIAARMELMNGLGGLLGHSPIIATSTTPTAMLVAGTPATSTYIANAGLQKELARVGEEGFVIRSRNTNGARQLVIAANTEQGMLYGCFHFLRLLQTHQSLSDINIVTAPKIRLRMLNHWDNLDRTVERGYAGFSIWNWHKLPAFIDDRYIDYARANASIGINATVLTNVNANATILTPPYLEKVKALAEVFRPYGIRVFLSARFSAPMESGGLSTADPLDENVRKWWREKVNEVYRYIPDFGGFLVKANSEGQPGPQDYKRSHADGANMLADALAPHGGTVIWRAFVYSPQNTEDRHRQAYSEFYPLDGKFHTNVMVQVKNGPIDFMPREPFHPLFGAMPKTPLAMEFQVTQEYLGQATNLVFLAPLFRECLQSDTYAKGAGCTVAKVVDGSLGNHAMSAIAGVANIGNDINWCGHPFGQANWYALGRLAWDHQLTSEQIADEWLRMTFTNSRSFLTALMPILLNSREVMVDYSNPLGLHHIMNTGHHYGPAPWVNDQKRPEWNPVYYHQADNAGIGFNRTATGSNALGQYHPMAIKTWEDPATCDERFLLWFHHVSWNRRMQSGRTLWEELCSRYYEGARKVKAMQATWASVKDKVDVQRFREVSMLLQVQYDEAIWWRNACLLYFQQINRLPLPAGYEQPDRTLEYYKSLRFPFAPGN